MFGRKCKADRRRRGAALVYVVVVMGAMMGLCSLAVDLGRYEVAHSQLYNAAVAASRAGAAAMAKSGSTASSVTTAATNAAIANSTDGQPITSGMLTIQFIKWNTANRTATVESTANFSQANAVRVYVTYNVPLAFAQALGLAKKTAIEHSTAMMNVQTDKPTVYATGDVWLAGEPAGTHASQADPNYSSSNPNSDHLYPYDTAGTPGYNAAGNAATTANYSSSKPNSSPIQIAFTVTPGATITITNTSGTVSYDHATSVFLDPTANTNSQGIVPNAAANGISEHGIADSNMPLGSMNAVFLGSGLPDNIATVPPVLDFSTQAKRDYVGLQPELQQPFYVGTGQTSGGTQQQIVVPAKATRMFMGVMDSWEWDNNNGSFGCTVTQVTILTVE